MQFYTMKLTGNGQTKHRMVEALFLDYNTQKSLLSLGWYAIEHQNLLLKRMYDIIDLKTNKLYWHHFDTK